MKSRKMSNNLISVSSLNCLSDIVGGRDELFWHMGLRPCASGEYSMAVVQANSILEDQGQVFNSPTATYIGVHDGHGGPEASRFVSNHFFSTMHKFVAEHGEISENVIKKEIDATEEDFLHFLKASWSTQPQIASAGSCCLFGAISNDTLYVANLGDSRAVLGRRTTDGKKSNSVVAERLSTDHNVGVEEMRREVEALHPDDSRIVVCCRGVWRIKGIIQVSRSIGDVYLKKPEFHRPPLVQQSRSFVPLTSPVVSAEPSIVTRKLMEEDMFLIFASDGLWEQLTDEAAVDIVSKSPRLGIAKRLVRAAMEKAAKKREITYNKIKRIKRGLRRAFHDDITAIVIFLDRSAAGSSSNAISMDNRNAINCTDVPVDIFSFNSANGPEGSSIVNMA